MIFPKLLANQVAASLLAVNIIGVDAHGYLKSPRSRNYRASINPIWSGGTATDPAPENCPHCLNIGGSEARCGKVGDHNYDYPPNSIGGILPPAIQACYEEGAIIDIESVLTAHHKGHFEVKACAVSPGQVASQECFDANPLTFVEDKLYGAPVDPLYPGRAYIPRTDFSGMTRGPDGNYPFHHLFKLPSGLRGDLVLLQWYYLTANSCVTEGYNTYAWPEGFYPGDLPVCQSIPPDGRGVPEQFWNCAEVAIKVGNGCGGTSSPPPVASLPTSRPTAISTPLVSNPPVSSSTTTSSTLATSTTTSNANNSNCASQTATCGRDKPCANGMCCSQWGYCGTGDAYCGACCQNGNCLNLVSPTTKPTTTQPQSTPSPTNPLPSTTTTTSTTSTSATTSTTTSSSAGLVLNNAPRCGKSEIDAREQCRAICSTDSDCGAGEFCWSVHSNYCGSIPQRVYNAPVQSSVSSRCGVSEEMARTFCGEPCSWQCSKPGESCISVHSNYCGSTFTEVGVTTTTVATTSSTATNPAPTQNPTLNPTSLKPTSKPTSVGQTASPTSQSPTQKPSTKKPTTASPTSTPTTQSPTQKPTTSKPTTRSPTQQPSSAKPTTLFPSSSPATLPPISSAAAAVEAVLEANKADIDNKILLSQEPSMQWVPSTIYRYADLLDGLRVMYNDGVANKYFYMGDNSPNGHIYGLVNIAAFLAQSMKETIQYNACDENSWDLVNGKYPVSNACGQLGQSYQDYKCSESEAHMECEVKADMEITATTNAKWWGAPAPLYCGPKSKYPFTGIWDHTKECNMPWNNPPEYCDDYQGQKAGGFDNSSPFPNSSGRTDVEGCCFWGRGVIQSTGVCNFGKLNYYLGKRAYDEGRDSRYPDINFCETPDAICASQEHKELKWIAGMFYWVESLQSYNVGGWDYITELKKYVDGGMVGNSFIDAVSGIVNRGCHNPPCMTGDVDGREDRSSNFRKVLTVFDL